MIIGYVIYHKKNRTVMKGHADEKGINIKTTKAFNTSECKEATIFFDEEEAKRTAKLVEGSTVKKIEFDVPVDSGADPDQTELQLGEE